jgi:predicted nucleic acid-binding Zn finger protein
MDARQQRGLEIAAKCKITPKGKVWVVPSQTAAGKYTVCPDGETPYCSCPDHEATGKKCKHIYAVEFVILREQNPDGSETITETVTISQTVKRTTYPQNWRAYNAAQTSEKDTFQVLLHDLCKAIPERPQSMGRPRINLPDAIFAAVFKFYSTVSGRRFMSDLRDSHSKGHIGRIPSYNSIFSVFDSESTFGVLRSLVLESARPLKALETTFACDSSGFSGCRFDKWFDHKYGDNHRMRSWVKAHVMTGTKTNVITAVEIHDPYTGDTSQFKPLFHSTRERFDVKEVSADLAYSTHDNLETVVAAGVTPYIPFKKNSSDAAGGLWAQMYHYFHLHRDEFDAHYHQRSNVESTFSMVKAKFGDGCRSKLDVAMKNEVLAKCLCHNLCCVIQSMHEFGIDPTFRAESSVAQKVGVN